VAPHPGSRARLTARQAAFFPGDSLFAKLARAVCAAECLPRKELFEAWEVARRVRRRMRGGRVVDLAAGHGLLAYAMLLLDDSSPRAVCVDSRKPESAERLRIGLESAWPRLAGRVRYEQMDIGGIGLTSEDVVVSVHACGRLTDVALDMAVDAQARVAVLPCCHDLADADTGGLEGWMDGPLAMDVVRATRLAEAEYRVWTGRIPEAITPKNRLLTGEPRH